MIAALLVLAYFVVGSAVAFRSSPLGRNALAFLWLWPVLVLVALASLLAPVSVANFFFRWSRRRSSSK